MNRTVYLVIALFTLPGCVSDEDITTQEVHSGGEDELSGLNIVAQTLGRNADGSHTYNLLEESGNESTLILWAAAGCNGCHQWTQMIRECVENGTIPEDTHIVTVHRYPSFEDPSYVNRTYGNNSSENYSPWPVLLPDEGSSAWDATSGEISDVPLTEAFNNPVTPTLQILDNKGQLVWQSKTYYSDFSVIEEITEVMT